MYKLHENGPTNFKIYISCIFQVVMLHTISSRSIIYLLSTLTAVLLVFQFNAKQFFNNHSKLKFKTIQNNQSKRRPSICVQQKFENLIEPCKQALHWKNGYQNKVNRTKASFTNIFINISTIGNPSIIILHTFDQLQRRKRIGGDFWRGTVVNESFRKSLQFIDHRNGTYSAYFAVPEAGNYTFDLYLEHSMCEGIVDPPTGWFSKGKIYFKWILSPDFLFFNPTCPGL